MCKNVAMVPMKKTADSGEFDKSFPLDFQVAIAC